ncbi:MAG TPA: hypothetical protein PLL72_03800 [Burkholderiaceae bacterium]|nr:hypothetical protein [Burkholderiaceae bacterium]
MSISHIGAAARAAYYAEKRPAVNAWDSAAEAAVAAYRESAVLSPVRRALQVIESMDESEPAVRTGEADRVILQLRALLDLPSI